MSVDRGRLCGSVIGSATTRTIGAAAALHHAGRNAVLAKREYGNPVG